MQFDKRLRHALQIPDCLLNVFNSFNEEVVNGLGRGYGCVYCFEELTHVISDAVFNNIDNMSHS
jgi:hypothetical protein